MIIIKFWRETVNILGFKTYVMSVWASFLKTQVNFASLFLTAFRFLGSVNTPESTTLIYYVTYADEIKSGRKG